MKYFYLKKNFSNDKIKIKKFSVGFAKKKNKNQTNIYFINTAKNVELQNDFIEVFNPSETGDQFSNKICDRCFRYLPTNFFSNNRIKKHSITKRPSCKDCRKIKDGISVSNSDRKIWDKKKPKLFELFECPICKKFSISGISKIVLDHNHKNGNVRGYLCESCNTGIGRFDDDPKIVINAVKWLRRKTRK